MLYGIGDLHLDYSKEKPMDVFGENWIDHEEKIFEDWMKKVKEEDLVLLPGDISWALKLEDAYKDLRQIDSLPGKKLMIRGNHDYWWKGPKKLEELGFETIEFIQNNSYRYGDIGIYGTRGWSPRDSEDFTDKDEKIFLRELMRLELSLNSLKDVDKKIVMIHYPPFNIDKTPNEFVDLMIEHHVDICLYGHLHAEGHRFIREGKIAGIDFHCLSSDYIDFNLKKIEF